MRFFRTGPSGGPDRKSSGYLPPDWHRDLLYVPVRKGFWKQKELWDGTYSITDLFDILEAIQKEEEQKALSMKDL